MMTYEEFLALGNLLKYIEADNWFYGDSGRLTDILTNFVKGHYSTATNPKESV